MSAQLYDPKTGVFARTGNLNIGRFGQTATLLEDGRVLIAGGAGDDSTDPVTAELFDPVTKRFMLAGKLLSPRTNHSAALLADGRVLIAGGWDPTTGG
ncbi:MAG TPA: hypothetical protein VEJ86_07265, partial [Candidatus Binataceae bacterium]|nr:hypothetical protein [Candidatus Binataceae bacterium]